MVKRAVDVLLSLIGLMLSCPLVATAALLIWLYDFHSPFYISDRMGKDGKPFKLLKLRSMKIFADKTQVDSTSSDDPRVTPVGKFIRAYKLDELPQLWNVLNGDMSLVGPRPNVKRETDLYTIVERGLLQVRPGITDISSIVFSDLGEILRNSNDPNLDYNQLVRPWKSRLGLLYIAHSSLLLDMKLIWLTVVAIFSRQKALDGIQKILNDLHADQELRRVARRVDKLEPYPPPGTTEVVMSR